MILKIKNGLLIILFFIVIMVKGQDKEFSKNTLKYCIGVGVCDGLKHTGGGGILSVGYQHSFYNHRFRLNPNLTVGYYNAKFIQDVRDQWFNSINLETVVYFDLLKYKAFSITIGAGGVINNTKGLLGTGGYPPADINSEYFSHWNFGAFFGGGVRVNPKNSRIVYEIMPLNFHIGPNYFIESISQIGIGVKLK